MMQELVESVEGAQGAIFLDKDGEAVQWYPEENGNQLCLRGAYTSVVVQSCRRSVEKLGAGNIKHLLLDYEGVRFLIEEVDEAYFVLLELSPSANLGQALDRIQMTVAKVREEIMA
jgi:predicted regulator of Ras-like GTPase activity (Roadblock/LC7/MglB family)